MNLQPHCLRTGESDEPRLRILHDSIAELPHPSQAKFTTPSGIPASSSTSTNFAAIVGASLEGFKITVFPVTIEAAVIPAIIANGKFHGEITAPTPSGI